MEIAFDNIAYECPQKALGNTSTSILKTLTITCTEKTGKIGKLTDCIGREVAPRLM